MKKLRLNVDDLVVESFETVVGSFSTRNGTVYGLATQGCTQECTEGPTVAVDCGGGGGGGGGGPSSPEYNTCDGGYGCTDYTCLQGSCVCSPNVPSYLCPTMDPNEAACGHTQVGHECQETLGELSCLLCEGDSQCMCA